MDRTLLKNWLNLPNGKKALEIRVFFITWQQKYMTNEKHDTKFVRLHRFCHDYNVLLLSERTFAVQLSQIKLWKILLPVW